MQCKNHPDRQAEHFCASCGIPLCGECSEESKPGKFYCFRCAMRTSVSDVGTSMKDKREKQAKQKEEREGKKKWTPFRYFVVISSVIILALWSIILFGGEKPPTGAGDIVNQPRVFLFMVDSAVKRFAHFEGGKYPQDLTDLIPKYLALSKQDIPHLNKLVYVRDASIGYRLSLANLKAGEMNIIISPKGIKSESSSGAGG
jgi:hypothetical protein